MVDTISKIMIKKVITCNANDTLQSAAKIMHNKKIGCLIVIKGKNPVGIVTERDITCKGVANNLDSKTRVEKIMASPLKSISPDSDIYYADAVMEKNHFKRLTVMRGKQLVGIVTQSNLIKFFVKQRRALALDKFKEGIKSA